MNGIVTDKIHPISQGSPRSSIAVQCRIGPEIVDGTDTLQLTCFPRMFLFARTKLESGVGCGSISPAVYEL